MTPHRVQYFLAHGIQIATIGGALFLAVPVAWACAGFSFWTVLAIVAALPLGAILGMFVLWPLLRIICHFLNGAPFHIGDSVHILAGPHRDRVVRVYDVWSSRGEVRVELGEQAEKEVKDVLLDIEICRERDA